MTFTVHDFHDLVVLLEQHPEWQAELRRLILTKDILELPEIVQKISITIQELAEAQKRTEESLNKLTARVDKLSERVDELAEAQKRTEESLNKLTARVDKLSERVDELAEAQKRTEESLNKLTARVDKLSERVDELAEAQKRTEESLNKLTARVDALTERVDKLSERVDELAEAQKKTSYQLARLENRIGVSTEEEAADTLRYVLEKKGYRVVNGPINLPLNGEIDVVYQITDPTGRMMTAVLEAKVRLSWRAVEAWAQRMRSSDFRSALQAAGLPAPYLVYAYGMRADPSAHQAAETFGIGLITGRGEEVAPRGEIS